MSSSIMWASGVGKQHGRGRAALGATIPNQRSKQHIAQPGTVLRPGVKNEKVVPLLRLVSKEMVVVGQLLHPVVLRI